MRRTALLLLITTAITVSGCQSFDPTRYWKLNRGEDYMNSDDIHFSVPVHALPELPPTHHSPRPQ